MTHTTVCRILTIMALASSIAGCSINHFVKDDYPQYLQNNVGASKLPSTPLEARYEITRATADHKYEFRSATVGYANNWVVEFGQMLEATLQSKDVQGAFRKLEQRGPGAPSLLVFDLVNYSFSDFGAHVELKVTIQRASGPAFVKTYRQDGITQGGKMFWAGAFGMKNAIQQSTKNAVDKILVALITDLNGLPDVGSGNPA